MHCSSRDKSCELSLTGLIRYILALLFKQINTTYFFSASKFLNFIYIIYTACLNLVHITRTNTTKLQVLHMHVNQSVYIFMQDLKYMCKITFAFSQIIKINYIIRKWFQEGDKEREVSGLQNCINVISILILRCKHIV